MGEWLNRRRLLLSGGVFTLLAGAARAARSDAALAHALIMTVSYEGVPSLTLANTRRDGALIADRLRRLGCGSVDLLADADEQGLRSGLTAYVDRLHPDDVALLYIAAHGAQIGTTNYILLNDGRTFVDLLSMIQLVRSTRATVVAFLDACRNNPFEGAPPVPGTRAIDARGLQRVTDAGTAGGPGGFTFHSASDQSTVEHIGAFALRGTGVRVVFATDPTNVALDASGYRGADSPFAQAVAARIGERRSLDDVVTLVTGDVVRTTGGVQSPWSQGSVGRPLYLAGQPRSGDDTRPPFQVPG